MASGIQSKVATADGGMSESLVLEEEGTVQISCDDWTGMTAALEGSVKGERWSAIQEFGVDIVASDNYMGLIDGNGRIRLNITGYNGNPVYIDIAPKNKG